MTALEYPEISGTPRQVAAGLWMEWRSALSVWLREQFAARWKDDRKFVRLDVESDSVAFSLQSADGEKLLAQGPAGKDGRNIAAIVREARALHNFSTVVLQFPQTSILQLEMSMPPAAPRVLLQAVGFELERLSPIPPNKLYFDFTAVKVAPERRLNVALRAVKRDVVDEAVALCHAASLDVAAITFGGEEREADWRAFPVDRIAFARRQWIRWGAGILAATAVVLLVAALAGLYLRGVRQAADLQMQRDAIEAQVSAMHRLEQRIGDMRIETQFPADQKRAPALEEMLTQITNVLPDGTWLTEFSVESGKGHLIGFSKSSSDLIAEIDRAPSFANAQFGAPLTAGISGTERFDLTFDIKRPAQP